MIQYSRKKTWDVVELIRKLRASQKLLFKVCGISVAVGIIIGLGIPKEYTASTLIAPEGYSRSSSSGISMLAGMEDINMGASSATERDAIYPSLYPAIVNSTPFLIRLFDIKVREQRDSAEVTLSWYLKERQKRPWWSAVMSMPARLVGQAISLFSDVSDKDSGKDREEKGVDIFRMTREEAGMASAIASRINIGVDKKKRTITISVTMQDPLVATTVAATVQAHLKEYITEYRTAKAHRMLEYAEKLRREAQAEYYRAQEKYTRYADANRGLVGLGSRAEMIQLRNEMNLASAVYSQTEQQVQAATAKVEKIRPVYAVIQPVVVPFRPSKPRKLVILAVCIVLGGAGSAGWILFGKDFIKIMRRERIEGKQMKGSDGKMNSR